MRNSLLQVDDLLRGRGRFSGETIAAGGIRALLIFVITFGTFYGAVMGTYTGLAPDRAHQLLYSGVKVPLFLLVTFALCLPSFFVANTIAGLRQDFGEALQAVVAAQACVTVVLACLAPVTGLLYLSISSYRLAVMVNGVMFAAASFASQIVLRRHYAPLIRKSSKHRFMLHAWLVFYIFVGIQMGWVLRPFIGAPGSPVRFFRDDAWGNAYVVLARLILSILGGR
ncbi:MAG TPA: hypothetical protein PL033_12830 [Candidatus Brocadiia bacterium]|nr:hypothetical protein [Candidatus Brocadiia bacterium]